MLKRSTWLLAAAVLVTAIGGVGRAEKAPTAAKPLTCPVMKGPIKDRAHAPYVRVNNEFVSVCCPSCIGEIKKDPAKYVKQTKDPVTGKSFAVTSKTMKMAHGGGIFLFADAKSHQTFHSHPGKYAKPLKAPDHGHHH